MPGEAVVIQGTIRPDGTLELDEKPALPAGRVQITIVSLPDLPVDDPFWQRMRKIWEGQKVRGHVPRSAEEVEAERRRAREEMEEEIQDAIRLQEECRRARNEAEGGAEHGE
jgi:hypothetical protein